MPNEIGIGVAYDGERVGVAIIVSDDETREETSLTLYPERASYLGQRLMEISAALPALEERIKGMPFEYAEAHIYDWAKNEMSDSE